VKARSNTIRGLPDASEQRSLAAPKSTPASIRTKSAATPSRTIGRQQQTAAAEAAVSEPQAVAEALGFPGLDRDESENIE
jgi:hypothetical protein